jgi:beta-catenin-like protein 1
VRDIGIFENILSVNPDLAPQVVEKTKVLTWLLNRVQSKTHDENRGYAAELLSILLQSNTPNRLAYAKGDGVEIALKVLSVRIIRFHRRIYRLRFFQQYRRRDPVDADESEFMENLFDSLCSALAEASIKKLFLEAEGPDLMILMAKEKRECKSRAIKALDYAMSGPDGGPVCTAFVEALGLKMLFSAFMGKVKKGKSSALPPAEDIGHILGVVSSLLSNLESDSTDRIRLLAKFVENNYEKSDKLLDIRDNAVTRLKQTDAAIEREKRELDGEDEDEDDILNDQAAIYLRRLDGGFFTLQTVDYILAWIVMEDDGVCFNALFISTPHLSGPRSEHMSSKCSAGKTSPSKMWYQRSRSSTKTSTTSHQQKQAKTTRLHKKTSSRISSSHWILLQASNLGRYLILNLLHCNDTRH